MKDNFILKGNQFQQLNGLRAIAISMVITEHYFGYIFSAINFMWIGVDLFFVISGFLITGLLIENINNNYFFIHFYKRRFARIIPLYYLILVTFFLLITFVLTNKTLENFFTPYIISLFTLTQNYSFANHGIFNESHFNHTWSLCIEEQYYIVWPFFIYFLKSKKAILYFCIMMLFCIFIFRTIYYFQTGNLNFLVFSTFTRLDGVLTGAILVLCLKIFKDTKKLALFIYPLFFISLGILLVYFIFIEKTNFSGFICTIGYLLLAIQFACWIFFSFNNTRFQHMLSHNILVKIGKISYGLFLYHWLVLIMLYPKLFEIFNFHYEILVKSICLIITFTISYISFYYFENKIINVVRKHTA